MTRIYYTGDMANQPGWFQVTEQEGAVLQLREEPLELDGRSFSIHSWQIGDRYEGHCNPRFVTEEAYKAFRAQRAGLTEIEWHVRYNRDAK